MERRAVSARSSRLIQRMAQWLTRTSVSPNQISVFSASVALLVPLGLLGIGGAWGALVAVVGIQLRLLANVLDGLVAVEGGKRSTLGSLYNEFPDRIADSVVLVAIGYAASWPALGWLAALLAALTAYVRVFGGALGLPQRFTGPMAKQHRMAVATLGLGVGAAIAIALPGDASAAAPPSAYAMVLQVALVVIAAGSAWTCWVRVRDIGRQLSAAARP